MLYDDTLDMLVTSPEPKNVAPYYESEAYISHTDAKESVVDKLYHFVKAFSLKQKLALINSFSTSEKTLLDIGAGTGDFLVSARKQGWKIEGVEPNTNARTKSKEKGVTLTSHLNQLEGSNFQVITLWHVLEHLPDLENQIKQLVSLLDGKGILVIAVPNFKSYDAKYYKEFWAAYDVPRHLWHFSKNSIARLFEKHDMYISKTKPMWFDAFYVSLLSEKYKIGKQNLFKAFLIGLCSNISALSSKECSSHIYILKKQK